MENKSREKRESMEDTIFAVLMAAGLSRRFGAENKLLAPFRGKPLARHTLDLIRDMSNCFAGIFFVYSDERIAALANEAFLPPNAASGPALTLIHNAAPEKGQRGSVRLGVEAANATDDDYFLFLPCDQPLLDADTVRLILAARRKGRIVEPRYPQTPGNPGSPCLFSGVFRSKLCSLRDGEQPRIIKARYPDAVFPVTVTNPLVLADIDDRETLERLEHNSLRAPQALLRVTDP